MGELARLRARMQVREEACNLLGVESSGTAVCYITEMCQCVKMSVIFVYLHPVVRRTCK